MKIAKVPIIMLVIIFLLSCTKEECINCNKQTDTTLLCLTFAAEYAVPTKSEIFPAGVMTKVFMYNQGDNPATKAIYPGMPKVATSDQSGFLNFGNENALFIPGGSYDFYSISTNTANLFGANFENGKSQPLKNGIDYLWASKKNVTINTNTNIPFSYSHRATGIRFTVNAGSNVENMVIRSIRIGQSNEGAIMNLADGIIPPANKLSTEMAVMSVSGNTGTYIMLPLQENIGIPVEVYIDAIIAGTAVVNKKYTAIIPSVTGGFQGGTLHNYTATIGSNSSIIQLMSSLVEDWKYQNLFIIGVNN